MVIRQALQGDCSLLKLNQAEIDPWALSRGLDPAQVHEGVELVVGRKMPAMLESTMRGDNESPWFNLGCWLASLQSQRSFLLSLSNQLWEPLGRVISQGVDRGSATRSFTDGLRRALSKLGLEGEDLENRVRSLQKRLGRAVRAASILGEISSRLANKLTETMLLQLRRLPAQARSSAIITLEKTEGPFTPRAFRKILANAIKELMSDNTPRETAKGGSEQPTPQTSGGSPHDQPPLHDHSGIIFRRVLAVEDDFQEMGLPGRIRYELDLGPGSSAQPQQAAFERYLSWIERFIPKRLQEMLILPARQPQVVGT